VVEMNPAAVRLEPEEVSWGGVAQTARNTMNLCEAKPVDLPSVTASERSQISPYGGWIRLFGDNGFQIEEPIELRPREDAWTTFDLAALSWARRWPAEHIWKARRRC
jgi:hypothetical protein